MKFLRLVIFALLPVLPSISCATGNMHIPQNLSAQELIQRAQEASDRNRFRDAMQYYDALQERHSHDPAMVATAEYEIAFIHRKRGNFDLAREGFNALLERYETDESGTLPEKFRALSIVVLRQMDEEDEEKAMRDVFWRRGK